MINKRMSQLGNRLDNLEKKIPRRVPDLSLFTKEERRELRELFMREAPAEEVVELFRRVHEQGRLSIIYK